MVTYVQNKLITVTIIVDIRIIWFNARCMRTTHYQSAVRSHFALETRCAFATSLRRFSIQTQIVLLFFFYLWSVRRLSVYVWLGQTSVNENTTNYIRACALFVPNVRLALVWRSFGVYIHTFLYKQKMCTEVDAHKKWMTFIRRSSTNSDARPANQTDQNSWFFVHWTCVMVCVTGT